MLPGTTYEESSNAEYRNIIHQKCVLLRLETEEMRSALSQRMKEQDRKYSRVNRQYVAKFIYRDLFPSA